MKRFFAKMFSLPKDTDKVKDVEQYILNAHKAEYDALDREMLDRLENKPLYFSYPRNAPYIRFNQVGMTNLVKWLREEGYEIRKIENENS